MDRPKIVLILCLIASSSALTLGWIAQDLEYEEFSSGHRERVEVVRITKYIVKVRQASDTSTEDDTLLPLLDINKRQVQQLRVGDRIDVFHHAHSPTRIMPALFLESVKTPLVWKAITLGLWILTLAVFLSALRTARKQKAS